jgi:hypothetical protein
MRKNKISYLGEGKRRIRRRKLLEMFLEIFFMITTTFPLKDLVFLR